jgi:hypothetical protein
MESLGAASPGLLVLTTGLSKPFRRLEKYAGMLQELERHVEENHPDRGDTQRSVSVYKDIAVSVHYAFNQSSVHHQITNCLWYSMSHHHVPRLMRGGVQCKIIDICSCYRFYSF